MSGWGGRRVTDARRRLAEYLPVPCATCGGIVTADMDWDIGHIVSRDTDPDLAWDTGNWQIEHSRCNRRAGQRVSNAKRIRRRRTTPTSRDW